MQLIIATDLGLLRVYRVVRGGPGRGPHLALVEEFRPPEGNLKLSEQVSDQPGRFPGAKRPGGAILSAGERHDLRQEKGRRLLREMARRIDSHLENPEVESACLAVSAPIRNQLLEALQPKLRDKITRVLPRDLTHAEPKEILSQFEIRLKGGAIPEV